MANTEDLDLSPEGENLLSGPGGAVLPSSYRVVTHVYMRLSGMGEFWSPRVKGIPRKENAQAETDSRGSKVDEGAHEQVGKGGR